MGSFQNLLIGAPTFHPAFKKIKQNLSIRRFMLIFGGNAIIQGNMSTCSCKFQ